MSRLQQVAECSGSLCCQPCHVQGHPAWRCHLPDQRISFCCPLPNSWARIAARVGSSLPVRGHGVWSPGPGASNCSMDLLPSFSGRTGGHFHSSVRFGTHRYSRDGSRPTLEIAFICAPPSSERPRGGGLHRSRLRLRVAATADLPLPEYQAGQLTVSDRPTVKHKLALADTLVSALAGISNT